MDKDLDRASLLYSNQKSNSYIHRSRPADVNGVITGVSIVDDSLSNNIMPVNPVTGWRDNSISRLMSSRTPPAERQLILTSLAQLKGYDSPAGLTDDDLLTILPSRYANDPVEIERFREIVDELRNISDEKPLDSQDGQDGKETLLDSPAGDDNVNP